MRNSIVEHRLLVDLFLLEKPDSIFPRVNVSNGNMDLVWNSGRQRGIIVRLPFHRGGHHRLGRGADGLVLLLVL